MIITTSSPRQGTDLAQKFNTHLICAARNNCLQPFNEGRIQRYTAGPCLSHNYKTRPNLLQML